MVASSQDYVEQAEVSARDKIESKIPFLKRKEI